MEFCYKTQSFGGNMPQVASQKPVKKKHPMLKLLKLKKKLKTQSENSKSRYFWDSGCRKSVKSLAYGYCCFFLGVVQICPLAGLALRLALRLGCSSRHLDPGVVCFAL